MIRIARDGVIVEMTEEEYAATWAQPTKAERKVQMLAAVAARRWQAEVAGTMIGGVVPLKTDPTTQTKLTAAYLKASKDPEFSISNWKVAPGVFGLLSNAEIIAAGNALTAHIQLCFDKEAALSAQILAADTHAALDAIDIEAGWPS